MYLIVGLGNPEPEYSYTRHNMGFDVINKIAKKCEIDISRTKFNGLYGSGIIKDEKVILLKPQTYMNLSGQSIKPFVDFYKIPLENVIVVYDDISLDVGKLRIRAKGSAGGHNGIKNIIQHLGTDVFPRVKVGVGEKPKGMDLADYVLGHFSKDEQPLIRESVERAKDAVSCMLSEGIASAMNKYNWYFGGFRYAGDDSSI